MDNQALELRRQIERTDTIIKILTATIIAVGFLTITFLAYAIGMAVSFPSA
jgi:hypothetical protein